MPKRQPIFNKVWMDAKNHTEKMCNENHLRIFKYRFGEKITGNVVQFGGGSMSGVWSVILSKTADHLTVVDYSPAMVKIIKKTIKLNKISIDNLSIVCERMEKYNKNLGKADYVVFTYCMSFSNLSSTIKNITKHCKPGCKIIISETLKPLLFSMRTDLTKEGRSMQRRWKNNLLKIEGLFNKHPSWKKTKKKEVLGSSIPDLMLYYTRKK
jgi:2-polyprenyl-3-methyl-5-hydroxy-6-metoxy-1,4-benzoquinol methylase